MEKEVVPPPDQAVMFPASAPDRSSPVDAELKYGFRAYIVDRSTKFCSTLVICMTTAAIVGTLGWTIVETSRALAGRAVDVRAGVKVDVDASLQGEGAIELSTPQLQPIAEALGSKGIAWGLMGTSVLVSMLFAFRAFRRNRATIRQFAPFRKRYEVENDPQRSSANLTLDGDTPKDD